MLKNGVTLKTRLGVIENGAVRQTVYNFLLVWQSAIVNIALSCTIFELFDVEYYRDLKVWVRGHSM